MKKKVFNQYKMKRNQMDTRKVVAPPRLTAQALPNVQRQQDVNYGCARIDVTQAKDKIFGFFDELSQLDATATLPRDDKVLRLWCKYLLDLAPAALKNFALLGTYGMLDGYKYLWPKTVPQLSESSKDVSHDIVDATNMLLECVLMPEKYFKPDGTRELLIVYEKPALNATSTYNHSCIVGSVCVAIHGRTVVMMGIQRSEAFRKAEDRWREKFQRCVMGTLSQIITSKNINFVWTWPLSKQSLYLQNTADFDLVWKKGQAHYIPSKRRLYEKIVASVGEMFTNPDPEYYLAFHAQTADIVCREYPPEKGTAIKKTVEAKMYFQPVQIALHFQ